MNKKKSIGLAVILCLMAFLSTFVFAETIILKTGDTVEGKITERTKEYITIDFYGVSIPYYFEDIETIDGQRPVESALEPVESAPEETQALTPVPNRGYVQEDKYYTNHQYGIKVLRPEGWQAFDRDIQPEVFDTLLPSPSVSGTELICAFSAARDWANLDPLIMLIVQQLPDDYKEASAEKLVIMMNYNLQEGLLPAESTVLEAPTVVRVGGKKLARYIVLTSDEVMTTKSAVYSFVSNKALYMVSCVAAAEYFESYKATFEEVAASIKVY